MEIYGLVRHPTPVRAAILIGNAAIVGYLIHVRLAAQRRASVP